MPHLPLGALGALEQQTGELLRSEELRIVRGNDPISGWLNLPAREMLRRDLEQAFASFRGEAPLMASLLTTGLHGTLILERPEWSAELSSQRGAFHAALIRYQNQTHTPADLKAPELQVPLLAALITSGTDPASWGGDIEAGLGPLALSSALAQASGTGPGSAWNEALQVACLLKPDLDPSLSWEVLLTFIHHLGPQAPEALRTWTRGPLPIRTDRWTQIAAQMRADTLRGPLHPEAADTAALRRACWPGAREEDIPAVMRRAELCAHESILADDYRFPWEVPAPLWPRELTRPRTGLNVTTVQANLSADQWRSQILGAARELLLAGRHLTAHASAWSALVSMLAGRSHPEQLVLGLLCLRPASSSVPISVQALASGEGPFQHQVFLWRTSPQVHEALWLAAHLLNPAHDGSEPAPLPGLSTPACTGPQISMEELLNGLAINLRFMIRELTSWGIDIRAPRTLLSPH